MANAQTKQGITGDREGIQNVDVTLPKLPDFPMTDGDQGITGYPFTKKNGEFKEEGRRGGSARAPTVVASDTLPSPAATARLTYQPAATKRNARRASRRLGRNAARLAIWWVAQPQPKPICFIPAALEQLLGVPLRRVAAALRMLGWQRIVRRVHGRPVTLWLPPGSSISPRPRGRPRVYA